MEAKNDQKGKIFYYVQNVKIRKREIRKKDKSPLLVLKSNGRP